MSLDDGTMTCDNMDVLSLAQGSAYFGVILVVVIALSLWSFQSRDVP